MVLILRLESQSTGILSHGTDGAVRQERLGPQASEGVGHVGVHLGGDDAGGSVNDETVRPDVGQVPPPAPTGERASLNRAEVQRPDVRRADVRAEIRTPLVRLRRGQDAWTRSSGLGYGS